MSVVETVVETTVVPVTRRDVLHRAADLLEEFGWRQRSCGSKASGSMCLVGAVIEAWNDLDAEFESDGYLWSAFGVVPGIVADLAAWNDTPGRAPAEVVACLREAAERT